MVVFRLAQAVADVEIVTRLDHLSEIARHPQFVLKAPAGGRVHVLAGPGMAAARIGPEPARVVLAGGPALDQALPVGAEDEDGKGPVRKAAAMGLEFLHGADLAVGLVDKNHMLGHGR